MAKRNLVAVQSIVEGILKRDEYARNCDTYLYLQVCRKVNPEVERKKFRDVLEHLTEYGLPPFESVRRSRQKLQASNPALRATERVESMRKELESEYKGYAREE